MDFICEAFDQMQRAYAIVMLRYFAPGFRLAETAGFAAAGSSVFALADRACFSGAFSGAGPATLALTDRASFSAAASALRFVGRCGVSHAGRTPAHWRRVALIVARMTGKRVGVDTATRMLEHGNE